MFQLFLILFLIFYKLNFRISSQEIPSDVTVHVGETFVFTPQGDFIFSRSTKLYTRRSLSHIHSLCDNLQFPLVSKCGFIKKLASESSNDSNIIRIPDFPGGAEGFELVIKFCYDISFEINTENIAMLLCAAEYLEMTEEHSVENLVETIEVYLNEVILKSLSKSVKVLQKSQDLLPIAERVRLVDRCIDSIAYAICQESQSNEDIVDWWADDLAVLKIDMFRRVLVAMIARGFKRYSLGPVLKLYAEKALRGLVRFLNFLTEQCVCLL